MSKVSYDNIPRNKPSIVIAREFHSGDFRIRLLSPELKTSLWAPSIRYRDLFDHLKSNLEMFSYYANQSCFITPRYCPVIRNFETVISRMEDYDQENNIDLCEIGDPSEFDPWFQEYLNKRIAYENSTR